jgi:hypothetical protein
MEQASRQEQSRADDLQATRSLDDAIDGLRREIQQLHQRIAEYEQQIDDRAELDRDDLRIREAQIVDLSRRLGASIAVANAEKVRADDLQQKLSRVIRSRSWRLTSFFRTLASVARRILPRIRRSR